MSTTEDNVIPLAPEDSAILEVESATIAGHTCKVMRLGPGAPGVAALRDRIAGRIHLTPALTRRLDPTRETPCWCPDPAFDVEDHIAEHSHDAPVDEDQLERCVARLFEQRLDRSRPLWHMDVIELSGSERVIVWRIHHALADGTTAMRYARALLWDDAPELTMSPEAKRAQHAADEERRRSHLATSAASTGARKRDHRSTAPLDLAGPSGSPPCRCAHCTTQRAGSTARR
jgi:diacylglycerol O-acyltransferase / wax synthase